MFTIGVTALTAAHEQDIIHMLCCVNSHAYWCMWGLHAGVLPALSWLEPRYYELLGQPATDQHPNHDVSEVLSAVCLYTHGFGTGRAPTER